MPVEQPNQISLVLQEHEPELLEAWVKAQLASVERRADLLTESQLRQQSAEFLHQLQQATAGGPLNHVMGSEWTRTRTLLENISRSRALQGFTPGETATFVLSFKQVLFEKLSQLYSHDAAALVELIWLANTLLDKLALFTIETFQKSREEIIMRQQHELVELSTPVVRLWDGIVAVPVIGTLDSARTQVVMEALLEKIVDTSSEIAIIDITGVPVVDTLTAQHLLKTVAAARLMGAECIISGIRPQIAQTIVHLGVDLSEVITKADLRGAVALALERTGYAITRLNHR